MSPEFDTVKEMSEYIEGCSTHNRLSRHPEAQADAIAYHYTRLAALAVNLQELVRQQRVFGYSENAAKIIEMITRDIQEAHFKDLGIPLEWKRDETVYRLTSEDTPVE